MRKQESSTRAVDIICKLCLSIEHGLGNKGMNCVTQSTVAKAVAIDKGS